MKIFKDHADSIAIIFTILCSVVGGVIWLNGKFNNIDREFFSVRAEMDRRFYNLEKETAIIKTVLIMKEILPKELATSEQP
jgi:hypothetical protein